MSAGLRLTQGHAYADRAYADRVCADRVCADRLNSYQGSTDRKKVALGLQSESSIGWSAVVSGHLAALRGHRSPFGLTDSPHSCGLACDSGASTMGLWQAVVFHSTNDRVPEYPCYL